VRVRGRRPDGLFDDGIVACGVPTVAARDANRVTAYAAPSPEREGCGAVLPSGVGPCTMLPPSRVIPGKLLAALSCPVALAYAPMCPSSLSRFETGRGLFHVRVSPPAPNVPALRPVTDPQRVDAAAHGGADSRGLAGGRIPSENVHALRLVGGACSAREGRMDQPPKRACPKCGSINYAFRSRKQIEATAESGPELETKFRCKDCEREWKERTPGVLKKRPAAE
jgi:hypothetical protein